MQQSLPIVYRQINLQTEVKSYQANWVLVWIFFYTRDRRNLLKEQTGPRMSWCTVCRPSVHSWYGREPSGHPDTNHIGHLPQKETCSSSFCGRGGGDFKPTLKLERKLLNPNPAHTYVFKSYNSVLLCAWGPRFISDVFRLHLQSVWSESQKTIHTGLWYVTTDFLFVCFELHFLLYLINR